MNYMIMIVVIISFMLFFIKKYRNTSKIVFSLLLVISLISNNVRIDADSKHMIETWYMQQQTSWCWVACAQNSVKHLLGTSKSQSQGVTYIYGSPVNMGGSPKNESDVAEYMSNNVLNYSYTSVGSPKSFNFLYNKTKKSYITILNSGYYSSSGVRTDGHAVIMTGYNSTSVNYIYYYDPYDGSSHYCRYIYFKNGTYNGRIYDSTVYNV